MKICHYCKKEIKMGEETINYRGKIYCSLEHSDLGGKRDELSHGNNVL